MRLARGLLFIPIVLSLVVLGAHFLRYDNVIGLGAAALTIALLFVRRYWAARLVQVVLVVGALEWAYTLYRLVQVRMALEQPFTRLAVILGVVIAITLLSAALFQAKALRKIYRLDRDA